MAADIHLGSVYYEDTTDGEDTTPDVIDITWVGGPPGTQLQSLTLNMDKNGNGVLDPGETFFDTAGVNFGVGQFGNSDLQLIANGFTITSVTALGGSGIPGDWDGATGMILTFAGFDAGEHLLIKVDIDEQGFFGSASALVEGDEFQYSIISATFSAPHHFNVSGTGVFLDAYPNAKADAVGLPRDDYFTPPALPVPLRTAGAFIDLSPEPLGSIKGTVHADYDGDCLVDPGEPMLAGVTIELLDAAGNVIGTTLTDANGEYEFLDLAAGTYGVREVQPSQYFNGGTLPGMINGVTVGSSPLPNVITGIQLAAGDQAVDYNFCEKFGDISGRVHVDVDDDCDYEPELGDKPIAGVTIELLDSTGTVIAVTTTDANGQYMFDRLLVGTYSVRQIQPTAYFNGGQDAGTIDGIVVGTESHDRIDDILLTSGRHAINYDFCERYGSIAGRVIVDVNANNVVDAPREKPIPGVTIELVDSSGAVIATTTTDADGRYLFDQLTRGIYTVRELQPAGYTDGADYVGYINGIQVGVQPVNDVLGEIALLDGRHGVQYDFTEHLDPPYITIVPPNPPPPFVPAGGPPPPPVTSPPTPLLVPQQIVPDYYSSGIVGYTWHLSVVNAGQPRTPRMTQSQLVAREREILEAFDEKPDWDSEQLRRGRWTLRTGDDDQPVERELTFGVDDGVPVVGDFNGDGNTDIGVYRYGAWFIDVNGNGIWDEGDLWAKMGRRDDLPVVGDWDGDGKADIAIFGRAWPGDPRQIAAEPGLPSDVNNKHGKTKNMPPLEDESTLGIRAMQLTSAGKVRADLIDHVFLYGWGGDVPITGDWTGEGQDMIGIFRDGTWKLDLNGDGLYDEQDRVLEMGQAGDRPVIGDFNGDTRVDLGIYRNGLWHIDTNNDGILDARDRAFEFGGAGDLPVVGDWDGDGIDDPGLYRSQGNSAATGG